MYPSSRSRNAEEENLQVVALSASPPVRDSQDRTMKIRRSLSWEEMEERRSKGLCMFCDESETPDHHLRHKNAGILMIDSEDRLSNSIELEEIAVEISSDMGLSNAIGCDLETGDTDSLTENKKMIQEQAKNHSTDSVLEPSLVHRMCLPLKRQVSNPQWELSRRSSIESMDVYDQTKALRYDDLTSTVVRIQLSQSQFDLGIAASSARQVFDSIPLGTHLLQNRRRETFSKTWWFKFKATATTRLLRSESSNQESFELFTENNGCLDHFQSLVLMKEEPESVKVNKVKLETQSCNLKPDLIQTKMMVTKTNLFGTDESGYILEDFTSAILEKNRSELFCGFDFDGLQFGDVFQFWKRVGSREKLTVLNINLERMLHSLQQLRNKRKGLKSWMFKYKQEKVRLWRLNNHVLSLLNLLTLKDRRKVVRPDKKLIHFEVVFDMGERDEMFTLMSLFLLSSLVIQQVMRNTKIKFSKRWWFKYKYVTNGIKRLQIQLRYKCWLEFKEWFKSWGIRESWRKHKKIQLFTLRIREGMEEDMMENDQQQEDSESLMHAPNFVTKSRFSPYMVVLVKPVAYATHFLVGVGMDTRQCRLSLRTYRVWDPGGFIVEDATPWWIHMFCPRG
ncbi:hypothetical protein ISN45_Aa03g036910 [Arabidopsis thaliana x Arabidopsis arenosa]|uniref:Uncharacterized protein n=1 Tax=Arabidopsis thaliana x Arabidopsis arenosa TaxID=1240361 RepID=A0A8T2AZ67_9BRAS|nr:hypothetical protein ISN45_Aa03g036910 [Arabidopsis thaliana x Arabidopsis arenosa]